jgi:hypothetical protein
MTTDNIKLGDEVKDIITGFQGIAGARARFLTGCDRILIEPPIHEGKVEPVEWFDVNRIEVVRPNAVQLPGNQPTPQFEDTPATAFAPPVGG